MKYHTISGDRATARTLRGLVGFPRRCPSAWLKKGIGAMSDYEHLSIRILSALTGELLPRTSWHDPERNEQRIAIAVCDATDMTPERWDGLGKEARSPWLSKPL